MSRLHDRISKLESATLTVPERVTAWMQDDPDGPITNRATGETMQAAEWKRWAAETDGLHILRTIVDPPRRPTAAAPETEQ